MYVINKQFLYERLLLVFGDTWMTTASQLHHMNKTPHHGTPAFNHSTPSTVQTISPAHHQNYCLIRWRNQDVLHLLPYKAVKVDLIQAFTFFTPDKYVKERLQTSVVWILMNHILLLSLCADRHTAVKKY